MNSKVSEIYAPLNYHRELGYYLLKKGRSPLKSLMEFEAALEINKTDERSIIGYLAAHLQLSNYSKVLEKISEVSKSISENNSNFSLALSAIKAYCTMLSGDFEMALIENFRGTIVRRKPDVFYTAAQQCLDIIEHCIGQKAGNPFPTDSVELIFDKNHQDLITSNHSKEVNKSINDITAELYLGKIFETVNFLKCLKLNPSFNVPQLINNTSVLAIIDQSIKQITEFQESLRKMKPYYSLKNQSNQLSEKLKVRQECERDNARAVVLNEVQNYLKEFVEAKKLMNLSVCHEIAFRTKIYIDNKPKRILGERVVLLQRLYDLLSSSILDTFQSSNDSILYENRVLSMIGFSADSHFKCDPIIQAYKNLKTTINNYKNMILILERVLKKTNSPNEKIWCSYHLAQGYFEKKQFSMSQMFAKKCLNAAKKIFNKNWMIIATFLQIRALVQKQNTQGACALIVEASGYAKTVRNEQLVDFFKTLMDIIRRLNFTEILQKADFGRDKQILRLVRHDSQLKYKFEILFKEIRNLPENRRLKLKSGLSSTANLRKSSSSRKSFRHRRTISNEIIAKRQSRIFKSDKSLIVNSEKPSISKKI